MAKIPRALQKLFGSGAGAAEVGKFGSLAAGSPVAYDGATATAANIQALSNFLDGWFAAIVGSNSPAIEDMNALFFLTFRQLAYLFQAGIAEWETGTIYFKGSRAVKDGLLYISITDNNTGNDPAASPAEWSTVFTAKFDIIIGSAAQVAAGLATHSTWASAMAAAVDGQTVYVLPGAWVENATVAKQLQILGCGYTSYLNGSLTLSSAADHCVVRGLRVNNDVTLNSGSDGNILKDIFLPSGKTFVDNGTGNLVEGMQE